MKGGKCWWFGIVTKHCDLWLRCDVTLRSVIIGVTSTKRVTNTNENKKLITSFGSSGIRVLHGKGIYLRRRILLLIYCFDILALLVNITSKIGCLKNHVTHNPPISKLLLV